ncbi:AmmeMemoRadiSam system radical SAM enzyme [Candidatus Woesearchaeota archaeon]|nr:AmmeMemoRadiSam system radical SAM enzyme [Candidatus Woesearchaeota archaeon]
MKEASFYDKLDKKKVRCILCPNYCILSDDSVGLCGVRKNVKGKLYSLVYNRPCAIQLDPIEKKPLFHFKPGSKVLSIGTLGCNLKCLNCQNFQISQIKAEELDIHEVKSEKIVEMAKLNKAGIAFTYTEPTIFYEYMYDCAKLAKREGIFTVIISNGYINEAPLKKLLKYIDAANIDLKSFEDIFYKSNCSGRIAPVLKTLQIIKESNIWLEITNLLIPGKNDSITEIEKMCSWIKENLGENIPLHFSAFHPDYKLITLRPTPLRTLESVKKIAEKYLKYVYLGNLSLKGAEDTICPNCKEVLVEREGFNVKKNNIKELKCVKCGFKLDGVFV